MGQPRHTEREIARLTPAVYQLLPVYDRAFFDSATRQRLFPFLPATAPTSSFTRKEWVDIPEEE